MNLLSFLEKIIFKKPHNTSGNLSSLQSRLGYFFKDVALLKIALTHRSSKNKELSNERVEFLGDSILGLVVSHFLYQNFPEKVEGDLTKLKAILVSEQSLSLVAKSIDLGDYIYLSPEEEKSGGREKPSIISDAYEAIIGAIFLDGGFSYAEKLIKEQLLSRLDELTEEKISYNYKGELLEYLQSYNLGLPKYKVVEELGPDHKKVFRISVLIKGAIMGTGVGKSKKEAEQNAAKMALEKLK